MRTPNYCKKRLFLYCLEKYRLCWLCSTSHTNTCNKNRAGPDVDGQVLVLHDMIGMTHEFNPRFLRRYLSLFEDIKNAVGQYASDVKPLIFQTKKSNSDAGSPL